MIEGQLELNAETKKQFILCNENLQECVTKARRLLTHPPFLALVQGISGMKAEVVAKVFT